MQPPFTTTLFFCYIFIINPVLANIIVCRLTITYIEQKGKSPLFAVLITSGTYTFVDVILGASTNPILSLITTLGIGIITGIIYVYTRNIIYPIIVSVVYNFISFPTDIIRLIGDPDLIILHYLFIMIIFIIGAIGIITFTIFFIKNPNRYYFQFLKDKSPEFESEGLSVEVVVNKYIKSLKPRANIIFALSIVTIFLVSVGFLLFKPLEFLYYLPYASDSEDKYTHPDQIKKWTLIFYADADFQGYDPLDDFESKAFSGDRFSTIVLRDAHNSGSDMWFIDAENHKHLLKTMGELNMGDPETLENFIQYAKANFPAERYALAIYNHEAGWCGSCMDASSNNDWLTMNELQEALQNSGNVDALLFTAPCLMGSLEAVYEVRNNTDLYIGSEDTSGYMWWLDIIDDLCHIFNSKSEISTNELGYLTINLLRNNYYPCIDSFGMPDANITMAAVETNTIESLIEKIDQLSNFSIDNIEIYRSRLSSIFDTVVSYYDGFDFYSFLVQLESIVIEEGLTDQISLIQELNQSYNQIIINEYHSREDNSKGLTIYFPNTHTYSLNPQYSQVEYGLDFSRDTHWDEFLNQLWSK